MTYAYKLARKYAHQYCLAHSIVAVEELEEIINQAMQAQREADVYIFKEALKEAGIGGYEYDRIVEAILNAEVKP